MNTLFRTNNIFVTGIILSLILIGACGKKTEVGSTDSGSNASKGGDVQPTNNYLWAHHKAVPGSLRFTHKAVTAGAWTNQCKVDLDATNPADRDIMCVTESSELDLMSLGINIQYNIPAHAKCAYVTTMAPFFFQYEPPRNDLTATTAHTEPAYVEVVDNQVVGTYSATGYYTFGTTNPSLYLISGKGAYHCAFDYSLSEGPNCCEGSYTEKLTLTVPEIAPDGSSISKTTVTLSDKVWGGDRGNCLAGPALKLNPPKNPNSKFPSLLITRMEDQIEDANTLNVKSPKNNNKLVTPIELFAPSEFKMMAEPAIPNGKNFGEFNIGSLLDDGFATTRFAATYIPGTTPNAFSDVLNYFDVEYPTGYKWYANYADPRYFTIICTDKHFEVNARIRLSVREWNTYSALKNATEPTAGEDNESGNETDFPTFPKHDFYDWSDGSGWMDSWVDLNKDGAIDPGTYPGSTL